MAKHDLGDLEAIRLKLESWLRTHLDNASDLVLGDLNFPEESGESSVTLILRAQHHGEPLGLICRMEPPNSQVFDEHDIALQYRMMHMAGQNGIPVPPLLGLEEDASLLGSPFYIMGFVDGQVPTDNPPYAFGSWVTELTANERATMWRNGLQALAKIHQIDLASVDVSDIPVSHEDDSPAQCELDKYNAMFTDEIRKRMPATFGRAVEYLNANAPKGGEQHLCWGDSRVGNIIWKDLKPAAVIDWEMVNIGDPVQEVSWWYWIDYVNSVGLGVERLEGLPSLRELYDSWHAITGFSTEHSDYYDLFALVRYGIILEKKLVAMESAGLGTIGNFCVPIAEQQLEKLGAS
ncbi:Putative aminoglycoside phosphotransferase [Halioglobus japonicus]|nr:Putative aminoglycoside phosphotransferase [Halioglobus japonicus]